jgi:MFS family permease
LASWGLTPYSFPALLALAMSLVNLIWISRRFRESLSPEHAATAASHVRERNPLRAILSLDNPAVRKTNLVAFVFSTAFVAMEVTLTYLAAERFHYTPIQNGVLLAFLGFCSIMTQGVLVRRMLARMSEVRVLRIGLFCATAGFLLIAYSPAPWMLFVALVFTALGSGLINPSTTGLISLYSPASEQGRVLGIFRSLGALSRAITPVLAGLLFWAAGSLTLYILAAFVCLLALYLAKGLPRPQS